jgi:hypothetical protein
MIDEQNLIGILNYPTQVFGATAKMYQFAWTMEAQRHCMRRDYVQGDPPFVMVRDEVGHILNPAWDASVCLVARSQGLAFIDLVQDISTLLMTVGDKQSETHSFLANHTGATLMFGTTDAASAKHMSDLAGQKRGISISGGGHGGTGDFLGDMLGACVPSWREEWEPAVRVEAFSRLPVGVAYMQSGGKVELVDFRSK